MAVQRLRRLDLDTLSSSASALNDPDLEGAMAWSIGPGDPRVTISVGMHGDEHTPVRALCRFVAEQPVSRWVGAARLLVCNVPALERYVRGVDDDLNRCFGPTPGRGWEGSLAPRLASMTPTRWHVDLHSTGFSVPPYGIVPSLERACEPMPLGPCSDTVLVAEPSLVSILPGAQAFELGREGSEGAERFGVALIEALLLSAGCLAGEPAAVPATRRVHRIVGVLDRAAMPTVEPSVRDFTLVTKGEPVGKGPDGAQVVAPHDFRPVWVNHPKAMRVADPLTTVVDARPPT